MAGGGNKGKGAKSPSSTRLRWLRGVVGAGTPRDRTGRSFAQSNITGGGEVHGTACAEIVHAVAPDAEIYLAKIEGPATMAWLSTICAAGGQGHLGLARARRETRGDGSGVWTKAVDNARAKGVLFVVASGNDGDAHYVGTFTDADGDGWHDFAPGKQGLKVGVGSVLDVVMRWDAWTGTPPTSISTSSAPMVARCSPPRGMCRGPASRKTRSRRYLPAAAGIPGPDLPDRGARGRRGAAGQDRDLHQE